MVEPLASGRFRGAYSLGNALDTRTHELTPERGTVEEVVADLLEAQQQKRALHFAQIIDTGTLRPIEPARTTLARLRQPDGSTDGIALAKRQAMRSRDRQSNPTTRSFSLLVIAMAVICVATVTFVLLLP